jgi:hypothetical protein
MQWTGLLIGSVRGPSTANILKFVGDWRRFIVCEPLLAGVAFVLLAVQNLFLAVNISNIR